MKDNNYYKSIAKRASIFNEMERIEFENKKFFGEVKINMTNLNVDYIEELGMEFAYPSNYGIVKLNCSEITRDKFTPSAPPVPSFEINVGPNIKDVIFNPPATIILWDDGTKTVVKAGPNDEYDPEKGMALCISKKFLGNKGHYYTYFTKYLDKYSKSMALYSDNCLVEELSKDMEISSEALKEMAKAAGIAANTIREIVDGMIEESEISVESTETDDDEEMAKAAEIAANTIRKPLLNKWMLPR